MRYINQQGNYLPMYKGRYKVSDVCQLLDKSQYPATQTVNGVTFTNNSDGSITVDGTNTGTVRIFLPVAVNINLTDGHYYCMSGNAADWSANTYCTTFEIAGNGSDRDGEKIFKYTEPLNVIGTKNGFYIRISIGITVNNAIFKPQLFDLTEMYGAGNEPTTVAEFREKFPNDLYPYSPYCWAKMKQMRYKVSDVCQLSDKNTYPATQTVSGVIFTNNGDGSWTLNGTSTSQIYWDITNLWIQLNTSHKYLLLGCPKNESNDLFLYVNNGGALFDFDTGNGSIGTPTKNRGVITVAISNNISVNNAILKPQLFDLTEMYGAGNEPTTVEEFREKFPDELYPYSPKCYLPLK